MSTIPHCDELYLRYFDYWNDEQGRKSRVFSATRPDLLTTESLVGRSQAEASPLSEEGQNKALARITTMVDSVRGDFPTFLEVSGEPSLSWIETFDRYYDADRIAKVLKRSEPTDYSNDYLVTCCEFGALLGHVLSSLQPRLIWYLDWPYWESGLFDPKSGTLIPVFHWAIKKMSSYGSEDGYSEKVLACIQILDLPKEE